MEKNRETFPHIPDEPSKPLFTFETFVVYGIHTSRVSTHDQGLE